MQTLKPDPNTPWEDLTEEHWNVFDKLIIGPDRSVFASDIENGQPKPLKETNIPQHVSSQL